MKIGFNRKKIREFEESLRRLISEGSLTMGERLLTVKQMAKMYDISPFEVRIVIRRLIRDRMLASFGKKGTYVLENQPARQHEYTIGVITAGANASSNQMVLQGIEKVLTVNGYNMRYKNAENHQSKEEKILKSFISGSVAGCIIEPSKSQLMCGHISLYQKLDQEKIPYVFIRSAYPQLSDKPRVIIDDAQGGYLLTRHMIATIGVNIVGIFRADSRRGTQRHIGYVKALQEAGIPYRPELVIWYHLEERFKKPTLELEEILKKRLCDGIICYDDAMATNIIYYLFTNGYAVPEDIAVAGYGNSAIAMAGEMGLTTIAQPDELMGEMAAEYLMNILRGEPERDKKNEKVLIPELVIRSSTIGSAN